MVEKAIYFSPTGGVKKVAEILCNDLIDFTLKEPEIVLKMKMSVTYLHRCIMAEFHRCLSRD